MELTSPKIIKETLEKHQAKANKTLGQNFLIDKNILEKIIKASDIKNTDTILEVGPGIGTLTQELAKRAGEVLAIEKDHNMIKILKNVLSDGNVLNVQIVDADILKILNFDNLKLNSNFKFQISNYKVVANIPYYLTSPLIRQFLESENPPEFMVLMIQKEVAQRICAKPPKLNLLAVSVQFYATPEIISYVSKNSFFPAPKVDSAIIRINPKSEIRNPKQIQNLNFQNSKINSELFFKVVKAGFSHPRKQLLGNLVGELKMEKEKVENWLFQNNIKPTQRAETLSVEEWVRLTHSLKLF